MHLLRFAGALALLLTIEAASADNLLLNPFFDNDISLWQTTSDGFGMSHFHDPRDADDDPLSGSARVELDPTSGSVFLVAMFQNMTVDGAADYLFGADIFLPAGQSATHRGQVIMLTYTSPNCSGNHQGTVHASEFVAIQNQWVTAMGEMRTPADARCARFSYRVIGSTGDVLVSHFDNAYLFDAFELEGIFRDQFEN